MKIRAKRVLSFLMALTLILSLLPVVGLAAEPTVSYVTTETVYNEKGTATDYTNVVKNWGTRGELATFLSPMAAEFYDSLDYATLSGYSAAQLKTLMAGDYSVPDYDDAKFLLAYTDCEENGYYISDFYTGLDITPVWDSGVSWNREHTWPQSKSVGGNDDSVEEDDLVLIRSVSSSINSSRSNTAYGQSSGYYDPNSHTTEHDVRGDVARMMLYGYVRWDMTDTMWGESGVIESQEVLLSWMAADPVDTWEMGRNDSIQSISGTRNVFVDYPELAYIVLGQSVPTDVNTPSGQGMRLSYTVSAVSNDESCGTVHVNNNTVTAFPAAGYEVVDCTVTSGSANVERNGDVFIVDGACTLRINFAAAAETVIQYIHNGAVTSSETATAGSVVFLPEYTGTCPEDYSFYGWVTAPVTPTAQGPATIYAPGAAYTVQTGTNSIYALYTYIDMTVSGEQYQLVTSTSQLSEGTKVVVVAAGYDYALSTNQKTNNRGAAAITKSTDGQSVSWTGEEVQVLTLHTGSVSGTYAMYTGSGYLYSYGSGTSNLLRTGSLADNASWTITVTTEGVATVKSNGTNTNNWMRYNASMLFSCYGPSSTQKDISLYAAVASGTTMYTTGAGGCAHTNTVEVAAVAATCTNTGYTAGVQCSNCLIYIEGHELTSALGHAYTYTVVAPTYEDWGYTLCTCTRCDDSYKTDYTDALKDIHTVSFAVPEGVAAVESMECGTAGISLPEATAPEGYTFVGWTAQSTSDTETAPAYNKAGVTFKTEADTVLYALYSYAVGGTGTAEYVKRDIADIQSADEVVITMTYGDTVYAATNDNGTSGAPSATVVSVSDDKLTQTPADNLKWNIVSGTDGYTIYPAGNTSSWLYCTNANNGVRVGTNTNSLFVIDETTGYLQNVVTSRYVGVYRTNPDWRCYSSTTTNIKDQTLGFYVKISGGTVYYTTLGATVVETAKAAIYAGSELSDTYTTLAEAIANYDPSSEHIRLLDDAEVNVTLDDNLYIDLNGFTLTGTMITGGCKVYGMDTTTDGYTCDAMGTFNCVDEDGTAVVPEQVVQVSATVAGTAKRYLTVQGEDGTYSFHRFYLGITKISVKPSHTAVGYKAVFAGSDMVKSQLKSYGFKLWITSDNPVVAAKDGSQMESLKEVSLRLQHFDVESYGTTDVFGTVFMELQDGTVIQGDTYSYNLRDLLQSISLDPSAYSDEQMTALRDMCLKYADIMANWSIDNILGFTAA